MSGSVAARATAWLLAVVLSGAADGVSATPAPVQPAPEIEDSIPRHPLELLALTEPNRVLAELPAEIEAARADGDSVRLALLHLAEANACRVAARWDCQMRAGHAAFQAAETAKDPLLQVRGLIAEALARGKLQDFSRSEQLLAQAEALLQRSPSPELSADVLLNYSSLSQTLGKHRVAVDYAERGLAMLPGDLGLAMQVRLLRNLARSRVELGQLAEARQALAQAESKVARVGDPKLQAEVLLEAARLARVESDFAAHDEKVGQVLQLGQRLGNAYTEALAREALGSLRWQQGKLREAQHELRLADQTFIRLQLGHDQRRVLRQLVRVELALGTRGEVLSRLLDRLIDLETTLDAKERSQAADDFDTRVRALEQSREIERLQAESALAAERHDSLERINRLSMALVAAGGVVFVVLGVFFVQQRRSAKALHAAYLRLHESQSQLQELMRLTAAFVFLVDEEGRILQANPAMAFALGQAPKQMPGRRLADFLAGDAERIQSEYLRRVLDNRQDECVLRVRDMQGLERQWRVVSRLSAAEAAKRYVVGSGVDITEQVQQAEILREQSLRDALTGCFNRRFLDEFERLHQGSRWAAIAFDLDRFKQINDEQGHERGDQVLQEIARFLSERVRAGDAVVRLGGDEFLVLLDQADEAMVQRLLDRLERDRELAPCGFSLGAELRAGDEALAQTLARADAAMYQSKGLRRRA